MTRPTWDTKLRQALVAAHKPGPPPDPQVIAKKVLERLKPSLEGAINGVREDVIKALIQLADLLICDEKERPARIKQFISEMNKLLKSPVVIS